MRDREIAAVIAGVGLLFAAYVAYYKLGGPVDGDWLLPLILFPGPWLVVGALVLFVRRLDGASLGIALMLAYEFLLYYVVFTSSNSTAGLEYMFKPGVQLLLLFPLGLVIGWVKGRSARKRSNSPSSEIKTSTRQ